ncbi:MAG: hypothetical protein QM650_08250 [Microlunatus sp.]
MGSLEDVHLLTVDRQPTDDDLYADPVCDLILVGGVPGAGKSTAIAQATDDLDSVQAIDPEHVSCWLRRRLPAGTPYRSYRWLVHLAHTVRVLTSLLIGPIPGRQLVVHDPGTRVRRRGLFLALAHLAGWRPILLYLDVDRSAAEEGQLRRGRVVRSFDEHWQQWQVLRPTLARSVTSEPVILVDRAHAGDTLRQLCRQSSRLRAGPRVGSQKATSASRTRAASTISWGRTQPRPATMEPVRTSSWANT